MRKGFLDFNLWRKADFEFARLLENNGAWGITIAIYMAGLKIANGSAANPRNKKKVFIA